MEQESQELARQLQAQQEALRQQEALLRERQQAMEAQEREFQQRQEALRKAQEANAQAAAEAQRKAAVSTPPPASTNFAPIPAWKQKLADAKKNQEPGLNSPGSSGPTSPHSPSTTGLRPQPTTPAVAPFNPFTTQPKPAGTANQFHSVQTSQNNNVTVTSLKPQVQSSPVAKPQINSPPTSPTGAGFKYNTSQASPTVEHNSPRPVTTNRSIQTNNDSKPLNPQITSLFEKNAPPTNNKPTNSPLSPKGPNTQFGQAQARFNSPQPVGNNPFSPRAVTMGNYPTYSLDQLVVKEDRPYPPGVDVLARENYLSDAEFVQVFKMSKSEFSVLPGWKKLQLKRAVALH